MAKIIALKGGKTIGSWFLESKSLAIGRAEGNDVRLDEVGVSKHHAAIETIGQDHILHDLGSANGVFVNGQRISRHLLQHGDVAMIREFELRYVDHRTVVSEGERTMVFQSTSDGLVPAGKPKDGPAPGARHVNVKLARGVLRMVKGVQAGKRIELAQTVNGIGQTGSDRAAVFCRPSGLFIARVAGSAPYLNGRAIPEGWQPLKIGDMVDVGGDRYVTEPDYTL